MNSPEFEFRQSSDERAKLLILLGGEGWTLICRGAGSGWITWWCKWTYCQVSRLTSTQQKTQSDFTVSTYLHQAAKDPLLVIEKQWTSWDGRFPKHMLLYTIPVKWQRDCYWKSRLTSSNNVRSKHSGKLGRCVYKQIWTSIKKPGQDRLQ